MQLWKKTKVYSPRICCHVKKFRYIVIDSERTISEVEPSICLEKPAGNRIGNNFKEGFGVCLCTFLTKETCIQLWLIMIY